MQTGESEQGLRSVMDLTRAFSIIILLLHFYYSFWTVFANWNLRTEITDRLIKNIALTGLFNHFLTAKCLALGLLCVSLLGVRGAKNENLTNLKGVIWIASGILIYFLTYLLIDAPIANQDIALIYFLSTSIGYVIILRGGVLLSRVIRRKLNNDDIFNRENETFPQQEELVSNKYSLHLKTKYYYRGKVRSGWINFVNPRRGILIMGSPGSGKSYFIIENIIRQLIEKGFALFIYDYKFPELTDLAYNHYSKFRDRYPKESLFHSINFDNLSCSDRCNPISPTTMNRITDAIESSRTLLLSINKTWINKQGDFFVESPINLLTAAIWFLRKYGSGEFCTIPHAIELIHTPYDKLFSILQTEKEIATLINPFAIAFADQQMETLNSQMASVKIPLGRLASPELYYVLTGDDFSLEINDPEKPAIFCLGNNPQNQEALAPIISLYVNRLNKIINKKGVYPCAEVIDEFATIRAPSVMNTIATGRSNDIITAIALQDYSQLKLLYSREEAEVILNITGNLVSGQVSGETAKLLSERFGKIMQPRTSLSINSSDASVSHSLHLDTAIPASRIASLSSGEFVGMIADDPNCQIELKAFHCKIQHETIKGTKHSNVQNSIFCTGHADPLAIQKNYEQIKQDIQNLVYSEMERILNDPALSSCLVRYS
ncbi:MAG: conjugal transfer protein TraG [Bacteroidetes bacterium]|nr:MAG: conjugal transfer protein TraG [Bacteroidota bacterium]